MSKKITYSENFWEDAAKKIATYFFLQTDGDSIGYDPFIGIQLPNCVILRQVKGRFILYDGFRCYDCDDLEDIITKFAGFYAIDNYERVICHLANKYNFYGPFVNQLGENMSEKDQIAYNNWLLHNISIDDPDEETSMYKSFEKYREMSGNYHMWNYDIKDTMLEIALGKYKELRKGTED